jgi:hypothetical protein
MKPKETVAKNLEICIVSCSVLKEELQKIVKSGSLDAELVFVSKYFHVDYEQVEKNLRKVLEATLKRFKGKVVLVYGDLCLGMGGEMKALAKEYGVAKVDAENCIDCQMGGGGKFSLADPNHNLMFMGCGMIDFFKGMRGKMRSEGMSDEAFAGMFSGIRGVVLLDTCGDIEKMSAELAASGLGLKVLEVRELGVEPLKKLVLDAVERCKSTN